MAADKKIDNSGIPQEILDLDWDSWTEEDNKREIAKFIESQKVTVAAHGDAAFARFPDGKIIRLPLTLDERLRKIITMVEQDTDDLDEKLEAVIALLSVNGDEEYIRSASLQSQASAINGYMKVFMETNGISVGE